jgi:hypothetical protein
MLRRYGSVAARRSCMFGPVNKSTFLLSQNGKASFRRNRSYTDLSIGGWHGFDLFAIGTPLTEVCLETRMKWMKRVLAKTSSAVSSQL